MGRDVAGDALGPDADTLAQSAGVVWADLLEGGLCLDADSYSDGDAQPDADEDRNGVCHTVTNSYGNANIDGNTDADSDSYADTDSDLDADSYANGDANEYANNYTDSDSLHGRPAGAVGDDTGLDAVGIDAAAHHTGGLVL